MVDSDYDDNDYDATANYRDPYGSVNYEQYSYNYGPPPSQFRPCSEVNRTDSRQALNETERVERLRCYFIEKNDYGPTSANPANTQFLMENIILNKDPKSEFGDHYQRGLDCIQYGMETSQPGYCDATYDLTTCVRQTPANTMFEIPCAEICPSHATKNHTIPCAGFATRFCMPNGHWEYTTNYSQCMPYNKVGNVNFSMEFYMDNLHPEHDIAPPDDPIVAYLPPLMYWLSIISMLSLFVSFFLFRLRNLRCTRIYIHQNLLVAWFFKYLFVVIRAKEFVDQQDMDGDTYQPATGPLSFLATPAWQITCVVFHEFFYLAGHAWFFIEALYLHHQISYGVFGSSSLKLKHFAAIGWTIPFVFSIPWIILIHYRYVALEAESLDKFVNSQISSLQYQLDIDAQNSWRNVNDLSEHWLISAPIMAMMFVTTILLILCLRTIFSKIQATAHDDAETFKKTLKATLALLPLFGISILIGFYGGNSKYSEIAHIQLFLIIIIQNTQGLFISVLYCFTNKEVMRSLKSKFTRIADRHSTVFYSRTTDISTLGTSISESISRGLKRVSSRAGTRPSNLSCDKNEAKKLDNRGESLLAPDMYSNSDSNNV